MCVVYTLDICSFPLLDSLFCGKATPVATVHRTVAKSRLSSPTGKRKQHADTCRFLLSLIPTLDISAASILKISQNKFNFQNFFFDFVRQKNSELITFYQRDRQDSQRWRHPRSRPRGLHTELRPHPAFRPRSGR